MFTNIFDHAVIFQQYDVDLPPEDKLGIFYFADCDHVTIVNNGFHAVSAYFDNAAIGIDERNVYTADYQIFGKHAVPCQITGSYVQTVYFRPISCFWYNRFRGKS